jgi:hypothetical protein
MRQPPKNLKDLDGRVFHSEDITPIKGNRGYIDDCGNITYRKARAKSAPKPKDAEQSNSKDHEKTVQEVQQPAITVTNITINNYNYNVVNNFNIINILEARDRYNSSSPYIDNEVLYSFVCQFCQKHSYLPSQNDALAFKRFYLSWCSSYPSGVIINRFLAFHITESNSGSFLPPPPQLPPPPVF